MIRIQNIYHMLAYAFRVLNEREYKWVEAERFENTAELFAAILARGIGTLIKSGLGREYVRDTEALSAVRGRIELDETIRTRAIHRKQLVCSYDDFSVDSHMNRILKSVLLLLLLHAEVSKERKKELRRLLAYFDPVLTTDLRTVDWHMRFDRNNRTYRMLMAICYLVVKGLLQTQTDGSLRLMEYMDEQCMHRLYERFILEYCRREFPGITANASQIPWQLDDGHSELLPLMQTDIMLSQKERTLIIDAKYYARTTTARFDARTLHSGNLYQIFTYVKNKEASFADEPHEVSGMLLYAKTDEEIYPQNVYRMSGNRIEVRTLDLNADFSQIRAQLDGIAKTYFPDGLA